MTTLIIGGSGSGKSAYAESCMAGLSGNIRKYYIATMQAYDEEGKARIARHRQMRSGKGFVTIEQPVDVHMALEKISASEKQIIVGEKAALLECMSNLAANEMFTGEEPKPCEAVAEKILKDVGWLNERLAHLVIVTNNVAEEGIPCVLAERNRKAESVRRN